MLLIEYQLNYDHSKQLLFTFSVCAATKTRQSCSFQLTSLKIWFRTHITP